MEGTGGTNDVPNVWSDTAAGGSGTTIDIITGNAGIFVPTAGVLMTIATDFDWGPYTLVLPLAFDLTA